MTTQWAKMQSNSLLRCVLICQVSISKFVCLCVSLTQFNHPTQLGLLLWNVGVAKHLENQKKNVPNILKSNQIEFLTILMYSLRYFNIIFNLFGHRRKKQCVCVLFLLTLKIFNIFIFVSILIESVVNNVNWADPMI